MIVTETRIPGLTRFATGKVRDVYDLGETLLLVATDRLSAFDVVLPTPIPGKGQILTQLSRFWFDQTADIVPNHLLTTDVFAVPQIPEAAREMLDGRATLCRKCRALPLECVVRGYLAGSAWNEYRTPFSHGGMVNLYGLPVPVGLRECDPLPSPIFTPATKAAVGDHDENITPDAAAALVGPELFETLRRVSLALYERARAHAAARGILIADTKFEFGLDADGQLTLIDEALTPDSSRFWPADSYKPGRAQPSFDKQFVRDYLETLDWNKTSPGPELPEEIVEKTAAKYREAFETLTGKELDGAGEPP